MIFHTPEEFLAHMKTGMPFCHVPFTWGIGFHEVDTLLGVWNGKQDLIELHRGYQVTATNYEEAWGYLQRMRHRQEIDPDMKRAIADQRSMDYSLAFTLERYNDVPAGTLTNEDPFDPETWADQALDDDLRAHGTDD